MHSSCPHLLDHKLVNRTACLTFDAPVPYTANEDIAPGTHGVNPQVRRKSLISVDVASRPPHGQSHRLLLHNPQARQLYTAVFSPSTQTLSTFRFGNSRR